jgi:hypothetical protein
VANTDCGGAKPICDTGAKACRPCAADAECPADPGVCMTDGHCATTGEVIFVGFQAAGCPGADGSLAKPFCAPNEAVAAMAPSRHVIVILGAADARMVITTTGLSPVIIGRKSGVATEGSIPANAGVGIDVLSDNVLIRDLTVNRGAATGKGIVANGIGTKVTLLRVKVALGEGLGVTAESGASLAMDRCYVQNNTAGGVLVNGAKYDIQNSVIAGNSYGVRFASALAEGSLFRFNTIVANAGNATICDVNNPQTISASIVSGANDCTLSNSLTAAPTFSSGRPFHLTAHAPCPAAVASFPPYDIDGDARVSPIDCGADQFTP